MNPRRLIGSFRWAFEGLWFALRTQQNARIHSFAAVVAIGAGFLLKITRAEWLAILLVIGLVISAELLNTAIEILCDRITQERDTAIGRAKDVAASGVLVAALVAVAVGIVVYAPYLIELLG